MASVLVAYGSSEGQTATITERIGDVLEEDGHDVTLVHAKHHPSTLDLEVFDGIVVGASIHAGSHQRYVRTFVSDHLETLNSTPSAFVSVSLSAASADTATREEARQFLTEFLESTGWDPDLDLSVAGALKYSEYGLVKRFVMKRIGGKESGDTDTSRDYEYTDWDDVEAFTLEFADVLESESRN